MYGIEVMATAMHAAQVRLDVAAQNLANVSSDGFHRQLTRVVLDGGGLHVMRHTAASGGPLRHTGRPFDLALAGRGSLFVRGETGTSEPSRGGSFARDHVGHLVDSRGRMLLGEHGVLRVGADATIDARGFVHDPAADGVPGRLRMLPGTEVQTGFLETSNVDAVREMIDVLDAQRSFETAQKTLTALDEERQKDADDVARVKA